jgi:alkanesulfonate monooxygenase SsuD/methylene tetrahydromethanopterin reductase-like flavin-dependent oxidoreductase (luciferase family)
MMQIGIGLPSAVAGVRGERIIEWAAKADGLPFSSLGVVDRVVQQNYEPMVTLAAAAAVTRRIRLMPTVLLLPLRGAGMLAKQAASLDALSDGRLTMGLGIGGREDDYLATPEEFRQRGAKFERGLETLHRIWNGEPPVEGIDPVGPAPVQKGGPEIILGASSPPALHRIGRLGYAFMSGGGGPTRAKTNFDVVLEHRSAAGHAGTPRFVALSYFGIAPKAIHATTTALKDWYRFLGPVSETMAQSFPQGRDAIRGILTEFEDVGVDEVVLYSGSDDIHEVDRLAEVIS